jgi:hypothetical protein
MSSESEGTIIQFLIQKPKIRLWESVELTTLYAQKLALTSSTSGGRSVYIVRSRIKATEIVRNQYEMPSFNLQIWSEY